MDQFVIATCDEDRLVIVDGLPTGRTNRVFIVSTGFHTFSLDGAADFEPRSRTELVRRTRSDRPLTLAFARATAPTAAGPATGDA